MPGTPDLVFPGARVVVFCDGDFWHGRDWEARRQKLARGANADYWIAKIDRNRSRDREHNETLAALGWYVLRFWESEILKDLDNVVAKVKGAVRMRRV